MIKFFRKIRFELMESNKAGKYLKYAIGEILLVVIGILIALSINNWNENSKNKSIETSYLIRISKDLDNDLLEFDETIELAQEINKRVTFLQQAIKNSQLVNKSSDYFVKSIIYAGYTYRPSISNHSFEELKSSGRLALINNKALRVSIAKYYDYIFSHSQWNFISEDVQLKYNEYSTGILNQEQVNWVIAKSDSLNISKKELDDIFQRFLSKKEYHSLLPQVFHYKYSFIEEMGLSKERAKKLKREIQNELDGIEM